MTILSQDNLIAALGQPGPQLIFNKSSITGITAGTPTSLWRATGLPIQGGIPGAAAVCNAATPGAAVFANPASPKLSYLARMTISLANGSSTVQFHDRLAAMGGMSGLLITSQTAAVDATVGALAARIGQADYSSVNWWLEIYTPLGTTAVTATISYTTLSGAGVTTTVQIGGAANGLNAASRMIPILPSTAEPIRSIQSVTLSATTGTAGSFGVTATRFLADAAALVALRNEVLDWSALGLPQVFDDSCIQSIIYPGSGTSGTMNAILRLAQG